MISNVTLLQVIELLGPDELKELAGCLRDIADVPPERRGRAFKAACELQEAFNVPD